MDVKEIIIKTKEGTNLHFKKVRFFVEDGILVIDEEPLCYCFPLMNVISYTYNPEV